MIHAPNRQQREPEAAIVDERAVHGMRRVHRAIADLRRGTPVRLNGEADLWIAAAETVSEAGLAELIGAAAGPPLLLLSPVRAAALLRRPVGPDGHGLALRLPSRVLAPSALRRFADPTLPQADEDGLTLAHTPALADAALSLAKLARLLPAVIVASAALPAPDARVADARVADTRVADARVAEVKVADAKAADIWGAGLLSLPAEDVLTYPAEHAARLRIEAQASVPLEDAQDARIVAFRAPDAGVEHLAIIIGNPHERGQEPGTDATAPLVRLHSECFTGDFLGSLRCDCGAQLRGAIQRMAEEGCGVLLYLAQEGRGIGLVNKLRAYALQDAGLDTIDANRALGWAADERRFMVAAAMLDQLGIRRARLLTNNPEKVEALAACGIEVASRESHSFAPNGVNDHYLATKAARFGHLL